MLMFGRTLVLAKLKTTVEGRMIRIGIVLAAVLLAAGCTTAPKAPEGPALVGKVKSQPGNCYYRDATGKLFISPCK
jgi:hypothetical protein